MIQQGNIASSDDFSDSAFNIVKGVKLPPQPRVLMALTQELQSKEPSFSKIQELLSKDAAIAAKLLKLVNSPIFRQGKKIDSIERALTRLGILSFYTIVLSSCLRDAFGSQNANSEKLWEHSQVVAGAARNIAQLTKATSPEHAYIAGLFHDAALPIILQKDQRFAQIIDMDTTTGGDIHHQEELTQLQTHHAIIGNILARSWGLPADVCEAILLHHTSDFDIFSNSESRTLGMITILADALARQHCDGEEARETLDNDELLTFLCQELNIDDDDLEELHEMTCELAQRAHG